MLRCCNFWIWFLVAAGVLGLMGCDPPQCREVTPMAEIEQDMLDRLNNKLDEIDATDSQRDQIRGLAKQVVPKMRELREITTPKTIVLLDELQKDEPDRGTLEAMNKDFLTLYMDLTMEFVPLLLEGHKVLTPEQRAKWFEDEKKPSKPFKGSWTVDQALNLFLLRLRATKDQKELTIKIKDELIRSSLPIQMEVARVRGVIVAELQKDNPDVDVIYENAAPMGERIEGFITEVIDLFLEWWSSLNKDQKELVSSYMNSFKPCAPGQKP
jgi:Spy/CpxP family protein refolding chaperone